MIDRRLLTNFDWKLLALVLCIGAIGILNISSATASYKLVGTSYAIKQLYWIGLGIGLAILACSIDYHLLEDVSYWFYGLVILLLPFTRLVHFLVVPIFYYWRRPQVVIWNRKGLR